jgi:outer membrane immunogenic protein
MNRLVLAATAVCLAAPAFAADLPSRYAPAPYYDPVPVFVWSGLYAGINGQLGFGSISTSGGRPAFGGPFGGLGGATLGYNYQSGKLLVGAEGDIAFGAISSSNNFGFDTSSTGRISGLGTIRARVGYVLNDRALLYVTGGYAGASLNGSISDFNGSPNLVLQEQHYLNGFAVGFGVEYALTTKISIKGEYLYTGFGSQNFFSSSRDQVSAGASINLVRAGLNYHF